MALLNITYRLPVSFVQDEDDILIKLSSGGLVSALHSLPGGDQQLKWLGVADFSVADWHKGQAKYEGEFELHPVFLHDKLNKLFYEGFSNSVLWPLFHYFPSFVEYSKDSFDAFIKANTIIADKAAQIIRSGDTVWIHDYHLMPLAAMLRQRCPGVRIGFFLHTPFPDYELLRLLPRHCGRYLLEGLLGADIIGFQIYDYADHFLECVRRMLGLQQRQYRLLYQNRQVRVDAFPISIDFDKFHSAYDEPAVVQEREQLRALYPGMKVIFSVDRLDYSKGILNRLKGYRRFLELNPEWRERIVFILVLVPSRTAVKKYAERRRMIEEMVSSINGMAGNYRWTPVVFQFSSLDYNALLSLYTGCDVALISPLRDGMNLVAKEFVASRKDKHGVLLLSDLAGAAKEMSGALLFNPLDDEEVAGCILQALEMPESEQAQRLTTMQQQIRTNDVHHWAGSFIAALEAPAERITTWLEYEDRQALMQCYSTAERRLILLDYDGTLVPFHPEPQRAAPGAEVIELLSALARDPRNEVVVSSGRDRATLERWLGHLPITIAAEHGTYLRRRDQWHEIATGAETWLPEVQRIMQLYTERCSGTFIEEKAASLAWHYRTATGSNVWSEAQDLISVLQSYLENLDACVMSGNKVVEVKPASVNKGSVLHRMLPLRQYDCVLALGDDRTDEDMFAVVNTLVSSYSIKVGKGSSQARYRFDTIGQVHSFLIQLSMAYSVQ
ncbi:MAG: bifunctional alpha,alpha-trehalose-phosphate synthase (UDP-forming)/trehalose-phosphatase [Bacteroidetes bacterium]|nr:bifunctional alpha,alpha-trehalose-phosphate synthase (UDP-forming)/trehalose-phosphatase [Bacteroidota bacterium]